MKPTQGQSKGAQPTHPPHSHLEAFRKRNLVLGDVRVLVVVTRPVLGGRLDLRRRRRVRAAPLADLLRAIPGGGWYRQAWVAMCGDVVGDRVRIGGAMG